MKIFQNKKTKICFLAFFVTFAISLSLDLVDLKSLGVEKANWILKGLVVLRASLNVDIFKSIVLFGFTYFLLNKTTNKKQGNIFKVILAISFSIFMVFGYSYYSTNSWDLVFGNKIQLLKAIIVIIGYYIIFKAIIDYIFDNLIHKIRSKTSNNKMYQYIFEKHSFIMPFLLLIICWLPYLVIYYPGVLMPDSECQVLQYFGYDIEEGAATNSVKLIDENVKITNHHPVLHTVILGSCVNIGKIVGNDNFGIFLYTTLQTLLLASALAYIINFMKKLKTNKWIRWMSLLIFAFMPVFPFYAIEITKDVPFTCIGIFYIGELYKIIKNTGKISKKKFIGIIILGLTLCLFRNNGIYTVLLSLPFVAIISKLNRRKILVATLSIFIIYESFVKVMLPNVFKIPNTGIREMLSIPFQQTARYVNEYKKDVTNTEKEIIDKVLKYETLSKRYNPVHADPVKNKYNKEATSEDLKKYFDVWTKQLLKHPNVYIEAFLNNYYGYLYPDSKVKTYVTSYAAVDNETMINEKGDFKYSYNEKFKGARKIVKELIEVSRKTPVISWVTNIAIDNWILLGMLVYLLYKKKYRYIVFLLPSYANFLICFVSPANAYFRYAMPNIFAMPLIISIFLDIANGDENYG